MIEPWSLTKTTFETKKAWDIDKKCETFFVSKAQAFFVSVRKLRKTTFKTKKY